MVGICDIRCHGKGQGIMFICIIHASTLVHGKILKFVVFFNSNMNETYYSVDK